jgi:hypothetical protein
VAEARGAHVVVRRKVCRDGTGCHLAVDTLLEIKSVQIWGGFSDEFQSVPLVSPRRCRGAPGPGRVIESDACQ